MSDEEEVLTTAEVAEILKVHPATVNELMRSGRLKAFKLNRRWRVRRSDLNVFMDREANK